MNTLLCPTDVSGVPPATSPHRRASVDVGTAPPVLEHKLKLPTEAKPAVAPGPGPTSASVNIRRSSVVSHTESPLASRSGGALSDTQVPLEHRHVLLFPSETHGCVSVAVTSATWLPPTGRHSPCLVICVSLILFILYLTLGTRSGSQVLSQSDCGCHDSVFTACLLSIQQSGSNVPSTNSVLLFQTLSPQEPLQHPLFPR